MFKFALSPRHRSLSQRTLLFVLSLAALCGGARRARAQEIYAATGPGSVVSIGFTASAVQSDYGKEQLGGATAYLDANLYRRIGVEAEYRTARFNTYDKLRENTFLVGPKLTTNRRELRPYSKLLVGRGSFNFPFNYAQGSYFVVAPGAGVDMRVRNSRVIVRVVDFEYQFWPKFSFGAMHPYAISTGVSLSVF